MLFTEIAFPGDSAPRYNKVIWKNAKEEPGLKDKRVLKTELLISVILVIGFALTALLGYRANYQSSVSRIEQVSTLTADGIYHEMSTLFNKPVNVSLTMAHDSLLRDHLAAEGAHLEDDAYLKKIQTYLRAYQQEYGFDSVFLVSAATGRYYNFDGLDRVLRQGDPENVWYYELLASGKEYGINVDNDEVHSAGNAITVFVNCKIPGEDGGTLGVVGVGLRIDTLKALLQSYEKQFGVNAYLLDADGVIQISNAHTGYEAVDWFTLSGHTALRSAILGWEKEQSSQGIWTDAPADPDAQSYLVTCYIPELGWHLVVEQNTGPLMSQLRLHLLHTFLLIAAVIVVVLVLVASLIRKFNDQIVLLTQERQQMFQKATEQLYDNIYELNITKNCAANQRTADYFATLGAKGLPYSDALRAIAEKQIREDFRAGYIGTFSPENVLREYARGNDHLQYDFMMTEDGAHYYWMRIDVHIFFSEEDQSVHIFSYRKNIDAEKRKEQQIRREAQTDGLTGLATRTATERAITRLLAQKPGNYAFFMMDIDRFKLANDQFGHAFGDLCLRTFADLLRQSFGPQDLLGRIGGDEFVAFVPVADAAWAREKAGELSSTLKRVCREDAVCWQMSASIGVALCPEDGVTFAQLYRNADAALYKTKAQGKGGFTFYGED